MEQLTIPLEFEQKIFKSCYYYVLMIPRPVVKILNIKQKDYVFVIIERPNKEIIRFVAKACVHPQGTIVYIPKNIERKYIIRNEAVSVSYAIPRI